MSLRFNINDRSDYIAEYNRLQQKITAKIQNHEGPCGEDGVRGEDATGLVTTSLNVATFLCNLMQFKIDVPHVTIKVSGGQFEPPYYTCTPPVTTLQANTTYVFQRQDNATSHPFSINNENGITGTSTVTVTTGEANTQIPWVCTVHSSMNGSFTVV